MALKIVGKDQAVAAPPATTKYPQVTGDQMEVFGRLRMSLYQIASYYGLAVTVIHNLMRRPDLRQAYDRGRAETIVAIRQKQLQLALGTEKVAANPQMLIHAGYMFGDQTKEGIPDEPEDFEPSRFSWDTELKKRLNKARAQIIDGTGDALPDDA